MEKGKVIKSTGDMPLVKLETGEIVSCKLRGIFKLEKKKILVGDVVLLTQSTNRAYRIDKIIERKNELVRPAVSNVDQIMIVFSIESPPLSLELLDTFLSVIESKQSIEATIIINKSDLDRDQKIQEIAKGYQKIGYQVVAISATDESNLDQVRALLKNKTTAFAGPSGVGKTSLLSKLLRNEDLEIGEISNKSNKGKHTTKVVELFEINVSSFVFDTPGFTTVDLYEIELDELEDTFIEFREYKNKCRFRECSHIKEIGCEIQKQVQNGKIDKERYDRYVSFYEKLKKKDEVREKSHKHYKGKKRFIK